MRYLNVVYQIQISHVQVYLYAVEPDITILDYNNIPAITMKIQCPGKSYNKMYGKEPQYNDT